MMKGVLLFIVFACVASAARSDDCWTCKKVVTVARSLEGSIEDRMDRVCDNVFAWMKGKCEQIVDRYYDEIAGSDDLDAAQVCADVCQTSLVKLVPAIADMEVKTEPLVKLQPAVKPAPMGIGCTICTLIVGYAEDKLESNATLTEIETFLNTTVCGLLPSFLRPECAALVDEYAPKIAANIEKGYPASVVCEDVGLCSKNKAQVLKPLVKLVPAIADMEVKTEPLVKLQPAVKKPLVKLVPAIADMEVKTEPLVKLQPAVKPAPMGIGCTICTLIVGYAEDKLESNATLTEIETFLNTTVCGLLPSFLRPECAALVDEYAPKIAANIEKGYPASVVCEDVGLCSKNKAQVLKPLVKLVPAIADMEVKTELLVKLQPAVKPAPQGIGCTICTLIVGYAEDKLESNATLTEIETFLNTTVCGLLPSFLRGECAVLVDEYAPKIAANIEKGYPASVVCEDVGLCPKKKATLIAQAKPAPLGIGCTICTLIVGYAEDKLESNATLAEIETFLNTTVCGLLPSFLRPECAALVDEYAPQIAQKIMQGYPASVICKDIHLCSSSKAVVKPELMMKLQPATNSIACAVCRLVINAAEEELNNGATDTAIENFLNTTVCQHLPSLFRTECADLVDDYLPELIGHVLENNNATTVCHTDLRLC